VCARSPARPCPGSSHLGVAIFSSSTNPSTRRAAARRALAAGTALLAAALTVPAGTAFAADGPPATTDPHLWPAQPHTGGPAGGTLASCGPGTPAAELGWITAGDQWTAATVADPQRPKLRSWTRVRDLNEVNHPDVVTGYSEPVDSGSTATFFIPEGPLLDGHTYGYTVQAAEPEQDVQLGAPTVPCHFRVDLTPPAITLPTVVDDPAHQFPPSGNGQTTGLHPGQTGSLPFTLADPDPSGLGASGVACVRWSSLSVLSGEPWHCGSELPAGSVQVTPTQWGTNNTYFQVADNAGNVSPVVAYSYYVPMDPADAPHFGDVTGDNLPDVVTADASGALRAWSGPGHPGAAGRPGTVVSSAVRAPGGTWSNGVQYTHRGSLLGGSNVDDLLVHAAGQPVLETFRNDPFYGDRFATVQYVDKPACLAGADVCAGYAADWSRTLAIAALGDPTRPDLDVAQGFENRTGMLAVEADPAGTDAALWYYPAMGNGRFVAPVRLAASGWKDRDLVSPGDWSGQGHPGLWARDRATGALHALTFTVDTLSVTVPGYFGDWTYTFPAATGIGSDTVIGSAPVAEWPVIGSDGDLTGSGQPTLWGVTPTGEIQLRTGHRTGTAGAPGFAWDGGPVTVATTGPTVG